MNVIAWAIIAVALITLAVGPIHRLRRADRTVTQAVAASRVRQAARVEQDEFLAERGSAWPPEHDPVNRELWLIIDQAAAS